MVEKILKYRSQNAGMFVCIESFFEIFVFKKGFFTAVVMYEICVFVETFIFLFKMYVHMIKFL